MASTVDRVWVNTNALGVQLEVNAERTRQRVQWGDDHDQRHNAHDWIALITEHAGRALEAHHRNAYSPAYRQQLIRVAALAVAAVEALDANNSLGSNGSD